MDPLTIFAAFAPLLVDGGKALIQKFFAPDEFKPSKIEDYIAMRRLDLEMFQAMNAAGGVNPSYPWVEAIVRLQRPFVAVTVLTVWAWAHGYGAEAEAVKGNIDSINNFAGVVGFYLFGDRTLFYVKKSMGKG